MEVLLLKGSFTSALKLTSLVPLPNKALTYLDTIETHWNLGGFLTNQEYSKTPYTSLCTNLYTKDL